MTALPDIRSYTDYRLYLRDRYAAGKRLNPGFSHRYIADTVGASSTGWFSDMVKGRISLTGTYRIKLTKLLGLGPAESEYFEAMVDYAHAGSLEEKNRHWERMLSGKDLKVDFLGKDKFDYYSKWYHAAIRELLLFQPFRGDYADLGRSLVPSIRPDQARKAIKLLERLGLIAQDGNGIHRPTSAILKKDAAEKALHLANFLKANAELGIEALERFPKEERDISALTLALRPQDFERAQEEIKALRKRLLALSEKPGPDKRVYQCNFQVFPLTRATKATDAARNGSAREAQA
ncbi:MAG: TIGR02147 family protein [Fibrobacteres bacterium]|nr:TIGR02147 family protein [Fibrobacterota bacterium]